MAKCKWCETGGLFRKVDPSGLCRDCQHLNHEIRSRVRVIKDSAELAENGKTYKTRVSRFDLLVEHLEFLIQFEEKGIPTTSPSPSELLDKIRDTRLDLVGSEVARIVDKALQKSELAKTLGAKERAITSAILQVRETAEAASVDVSAFDSEARQLQGELHRVRLDEYIHAAQKAEFKGNTKKAIDQYQEALYYLQNDQIDDSMQTEQISKLKAKLSELGA